MLVLQVREATKAALKVITEEAEATPDQATSGHSNCTIIQAVESNEGGPVEVSVCVLTQLYFMGGESMLMVSHLCIS